MKELSAQFAAGVQAITDTALEQLGAVDTPAADASGALSDLDEE